MTFKTILKDTALTILGTISGLALISGVFGEINEPNQIILKISLACVGFVGLVVTLNNTSLGKRINKR